MAFQEGRDQDRKITDQRIADRSVRGLRTGDRGSAKGIVRGGEPSARQDTPSHGERQPRGEQKPPSDEFGTGGSHGGFRSAGWGKRVVILSFGVYTSGEYSRV